MTPQERQERGDRAKQLLENPLFEAACVDVREAILAAWSGTRLNDAAERERLWSMLQALERVKRALVLHIQTGSVSRADIEREPERKGLRRVIGL